MKNYRTLLLLLFLCGLTAEVSFGQEYIVTKKRIGVEDGLSNNHVRAVYQGQKGFVWLSSSNLINRYDGEQFEYFQIDTINSLGEVSINQINEDLNGELWLSEGEINPYTFE